MPEIFFLMLFYLLVEFNSNNLSMATGRQTVVIYPYYLLVELILIYLAFKSSLPKSIMAMISLVALIIIGEAVFLDFKTMAVSKIIEPLAIVLISVLWLYSTFKMAERKIEKLPLFWVAAGLLVHFLPAILLLAVYGIIKVEPADQLFAIQLRWVLNIISKLSITVGLWKAFRS
ncbi:hypothetical protein [Roseivirga seohaensis]|uniref:hypothetical protein n=1 Tax=Roseivirga seohaensis TaxID=1914963 RepID=UPI003BABCD32